MAIKETVSAVNTTEKVASALFKWITGNRGLKATVSMELKENIELIRLYIDTGADAKELAINLKEESYRHALKEGFNFNSLNKLPIAKGTVTNSAQLDKYSGWSTEKLFENIYSKIATVKKATEITNRKKSLRLGVRLTNIFKLMVLLANHIGK
jgi:hypothetical protein